MIFNYCPKFYYFICNNFSYSYAPNKLWLILHIFIFTDEIHQGPDMIHTKHSFEQCDFATFLCCYTFELAYIHIRTKIVRYHVHTHTHTHKYVPCLIIYHGDSSWAGNSYIPEGRQTSLCTCRILLKFISQKDNLDYSQYYYNAYWTSIRT